MSETEFNQVADILLDQIAQQIDDQLGDDVDVDFEAGILTLGLEKGGTYIINKHGPSQEIWVSSPISGAFHFKNQAGRWLSTRHSDVELLGFLGKELGITITL